MNNFQEELIATIEQRSLSPKPRWYFVLRRAGFWTLAGVSLLLGSVASATGIYVFFDNDGGVMPLLENTRLEDILMSIPYLWIAVLAVFMFSLHVSVRRTKRGYRYTTAFATVTIVVLSILFGMLLNMADVGQTVHTYLLHNTTLYNSLIHSREDLQR